MITCKNPILVLVVLRESDRYRVTSGTQVYVLGPFQNSRCTRQFRARAIVAYGQQSPETNLVVREMLQSHVRTVFEGRAYLRLNSCENQSLTSSRFGGN